MSLGVFNSWKSGVHYPMSYSCTLTSFRWPTASKSACPTWIGLWWSTCNGSARILKSAKGLLNGCIDRFARTTYRRESLRERNAASPPTWWMNGFTRHLMERFEVLLDENSLMFDLLNPKPVRTLL